MAAQRNLDKPDDLCGEYLMSVTRFGLAEVRALTLLGRGDPDGAGDELTAAVPFRLPSNTFSRPLYELLSEPEPLPGVERLLDVWRQIIADDPTAAVPWGGPAEPATSGPR